MTLLRMAGGGESDGSGAPFDDLPGSTYWHRPAAALAYARTRACVCVPLYVPLYVRVGGWYVCVLCLWVGVDGAK